MILHDFYRILYYLPFIQYLASRWNFLPIFFSYFRKFFFCLLVSLDDTLFLNIFRYWSRIYYHIIFLNIELLLFHWTFDENAHWNYFYLEWKDVLSETIHWSGSFGQCNYVSLCWWAYYILDWLSEYCYWIFHHLSK